MTVSQWSRLVSFVVLGVGILVTGCGGPGPGNFAHVSGTVTHKGTPIDKAKITFTSTTEVSGVKEQFSTETDSNGKYMIAGYGKNPGLPPGMYRVSLTKLVLKPGVKMPEEGFDLTQLEMSGMGVNQLPKSVGDPATSKLSATLQSGKNENQNFDVK